MRKKCLHTANFRAEKNGARRAPFAIGLSALLLIGILVCVICDVAITGGFSWSLYPTVSILFAWMWLFPVFLCGFRGIPYALSVFSVSVFPFLWVLNRLVSEEIPLFRIGGMMAAIAVIFLWIVFGVFKVLRRRMLFATAIATTMAVPFTLVVNFVLSRLIGGPIVDAWDLLSLAVLLGAAIVLFMLDYARIGKRP